MVRSSSSPARGIQGNLFLQLLAKIFCFMFHPAQSPSSSSLSSIEDSPRHFGAVRTGTHKVHYQPQQQWDFIADADEHPIDLSLMLPHYRARNQPTEHRMSMFIQSRSEIKTAVCRKSPRTPFLLTVCSTAEAPVTLYLPSDFSGIIRFSSSSPKVSFSAGFKNHILPRVRFARASDSQYKAADEYEEDGADEVEIFATGHITLRVWDVLEGSLESPARGTWRKMCRRAINSKSMRPEQRTVQAIDWDFLLEDD
ncbi:hypothetical protein BC834DRAFT_973005 [Gloeopeniophorella convolvens]|nr:hypothetical protein BC834DRAFT_973005 [Gloeopeniophorella convolvens]